MARGEKMKCPHCDCKVLVSEVEKNDGACPECEQIISFSSNLFDNYEDEDDEDLDLEEQELSDFDDDDDDYDDDYDDDDDDDDY